MKNWNIFFLRCRLKMVEGAFWSWSISGPDTIWTKFVRLFFVKIFTVESGHLFEQWVQFVQSYARNLFFLKFFFNFFVYFLQYFQLYASYDPNFFTDVLPWPWGMFSYPEHVSKFISHHSTAIWSKSSRKNFKKCPRTQSVQKSLFDSFRRELLLQMAVE